MTQEREHWTMFCNCCASVCRAGFVYSSAAAWLVSAITKTRTGGLLILNEMFSKAMNKCFKFLSESHLTAVLRYSSRCLALVSLYIKLNSENWEDISSAVMFPQYLSLCTALAWLSWLHWIAENVDEWELMSPPADQSQAPKYISDRFWHKHTYSTLNIKKGRKKMDWLDRKKSIRIPNPKRAEGGRVKELQHSFWKYIYRDNIKSNSKIGYCRKIFYTNSCYNAMNGILLLSCRWLRKAWNCQYNSLNFSFNKSSFLMYIVVLYFSGSSGCYFVILKFLRVMSVGFSKEG